MPASECTTDGCKRVAESGEIDCPSCRAWISFTGLRGAEVSKALA